MKKVGRFFWGCHECCWVQIVYHSHHQNLCSKDRGPRTWDHAGEEDGRSRTLERMKSRPKTCLFNILLKHWRNWTNTNCTLSTVLLENRIVLSRLLCSDSPAFCDPAHLQNLLCHLLCLPLHQWPWAIQSCQWPKSITFNTRHKIFGNSVGNMSKIPRRAKNSTLPHHTMFEDTNCLHLICHDMVPLIWSYSWYVSNTPKINRPAPWGKMDKNSKLTDLSLHPRDTRGLRRVDGGDGGKWWMWGGQTKSSEIHWVEI